MPRPMKDSGVEWLGEIPADWNVIKLKYLFYIIGGNGFPDILQGNSSGDYPFCKVSDINGDADYIDTASNWVLQSVVDNNRFNVIPIGSIIMAKIGVALAKNHRKINKVKCCIDNNTQALVPKRNDDIRYLFHLSKCIDMSWFDNNSTVPSINNPKLLNFFVAVPPLDEQQRIATFLDGECARIDSVIEKTRASIVEYKKLKQAIITRAVTKGIRPARTMKDSDVEWLGEIPTDWDAVNIRRLFSFGKGLPITKENLIESGLSVISYGQIHSKFNSGITVKPELIRFVDNDYLQRNPESIVKKGDFIFADTSEDLTGCGNCVYIDIDELIFAGYHTIILRSHREFHNKYFAFLFQSDVWRKQIRERVTGVKLFSISQKILRATSILVPPMEEQKEIAQYLDEKTAAIDLLVEKKEQLLTELERLKKSLIFEYVTGKKAVAQ